MYARPLPWTPCIRFGQSRQPTEYMIQISPWEATMGLIKGAAAILPSRSPLYLYGPYKREGLETAPSNQAFDQRLWRWQSGSPARTEGRGVEPAGDLGIAGRARPPQPARQAVQSKVGRGHARGASAVANLEEPYAPRAKASSRPLSSITGSCSASLTRWSPSIPNTKPHGQRPRSMRSR